MNQIIDTYEHLKKLSRDELIAKARATAKLGTRSVKEQCEESLVNFIRHAWSVVEPGAPYIHGWHVDAVCMHLEAVANGDINRLLINIPPGPGWVENLVTTERGRIRLGDLRVGDRVLTHRGRYRSVEACYSKGNLPTLRIITKGGRETIATPDHNFLTPDGWVAAKDLRVKDTLAFVTPQEDIAENKVSLAEARLLGYLVGDGGITHHVNFTNSDEDVVADFEICAQSLGFTTAKTWRKTHWSVRINGGKPVVNWLDSHGLMGKSSYEKFIPNLILASSREAIQNFLGAYWSCDGMIEVRATRTRGSCYRASATTVSERLAKDLQHALSRVGIRANIRQKKRKLETQSQPGGVYRSFCIEVTHEADTAKFMNMPGLCSRKSKLASLCKKRRFEIVLNEDPIVLIEDAGTRECMCVSVEEDHSLIWDDIVVHNTMKSLATTVFFPAWMWGPKDQAYLRFLCASHSQSLAVRDSTKMRRLVQSEWYQKFWGDRVELTGDQNSKLKFENTSFGFREAVAAGSITGSRGDYVLCLPYDEIVQTEIGPLEIGDIVTKKIRVKVWSADPLIGRPELKNILDWKHNPGSSIVEVGFSDGSTIRCTPNHKIWTNDGWIEAQYLSQKNMLPGPFDTTQIANAIKSFKAYNRFPVFVREIGHVEETFCLTIEDHHTFYAGKRNSILIANCDDPHSVEGAASEAMRNTTKDWFLEAVPTRLNNPRKSAIIVIMQRLHEEDVSGIILEKNLGYEHLMLPMEFDPDRKCSTSIGFEDPRSEEGELLFPKRFPREVVERDKLVMGPYACNTGEAPVLMADLSLKRIDQVQAGDEILGWVKKKGGKSRMVKTKVKQAFKYFGSVVKMTLDSGEVIRCTPDHKWWRARWEEGRNEYAPARVGTGLARICPSSLPELSAEDQRLAGWLSGFFDGEGTVSLSKKHDPEKYNPSASIHFYQGAGRNLPLCKKLEKALTYFGFSFRYSEDERKPNKEAPCYGYRAYNVLSNQHSLGLAQKFLHIVQPTKWRDRIESMALGAKFINNWEKVVSIEPDGEEAVYALETETGNYVVWGLASSNSAGQFQQTPTPRGGGIIKRDWWQLWDDETANSQGLSSADKYPPMDYIVASLDPAYTSKQENDPSALTIWGVWQKGGESARRILGRTGEVVDYIDDRDTVPCVMLMFAWAKRLPIHGPDIEKNPNETEAEFKLRQQQNWGLVEWIVDSCSKYNVDTLLIESKGSGISVSQEIQRLNRTLTWNVHLVNPGNADKVARAYAVQPAFSNGIIYAPDRAWADKVMTEAENFPKGKHDDLVDSTTQALKFMRERGLLRRPEEIVASIKSEVNAPRNSKPVYDV